jgi:DNA-binding LacI/PurR family transcriptional regulator
MPPVEERIVRLVAAESALDVRTVRRALSDRRTRSTVTAAAILAAAERLRLELPAELVASLSARATEPTKVRR